MLDDNKSKEQEIVKSKFRTNNYRGTYLGATGVGKTKIGVDLIVECLRLNPNEQWIIVVPTENLRDNEWVKEFITWGYDMYLPKVRIECIQSAYKLCDQNLNAVVDEIHTAVSEEYKSFFLNNNIGKLLCFTATIDDLGKKEFIENMAPILHVTDINRARELGIVAPYYVFNLALTLKQDTQKKYDDILRLYTMYESQLGGPARAFKTSSYILNTIKKIPKEDRTDEQKVLYTRATMYWVMMQKRKTFLYNCPEKIEACQEILKMFPDRKALVFSETIAFAKELDKQLGNESVIYHSKMTTNARKDALRFFESDQTKARVISAVKALNAGFNVPECSLGICAAGSSKWLDMIQRNGRILRKQDDKTAIFVNLYISGTQDAKWVNTRTKAINSNYLKWITEVKQILF